MYAEFASVRAEAAVASAVCIAPLTVIGPVSAVPGLMPRSPLIDDALAALITDEANAPKVLAAPRLGAVPVAKA